MRNALIIGVLSLLANKKTWIYIFGILVACGFQVSEEFASVASEIAALVANILKAAIGT